MASENIFSVTRRRLFDFVLGGGFLVFAGAIVYPAFRFLLPSKFASTSEGSVRVAKTSEIKRNSAKLFRFGSGVGILVRTTSGEFRAFEGTCTHLSCTVQYREDLEHIWCACHNGHFDLVGRNIQGPPPKPLQQFEVKVRGDEIFVSRKA